MPLPYSVVDPSVLEQSARDAAKTLVELDRDVFDHADTESHTYKATPGLSEKLVREISKQKNEPSWMLDIRLRGLHAFLDTPVPEWGPDLSALKFDDIIYYARPDAKGNATNWDDVPSEIKKTFDRLGIPQAEQKYLAGAGAQYDSDVVYHKIRDDLAAKGVIFEDMDVALHKYPDLVKEYFMTKCIPVTDHKFIMLHAAVWSGGTFIYVPKHVHVDLPLQAYFRMNAKRGGQFEHTLIIVEEGAQLHYIEGCFTKGTLVQSNPDYKPIEDIKIGDKVMTDSGEYKNVYNTQVIPYSGDLYTIETYGDSTQRMEVTAGHPILSVKRLKKRDRNKQWKKSWMIPKYLNKLDYLTIPINKTIISNSTRKYSITHGVGRHKPKKYEINVPLSKDFFRLIGYYLAEGSVSGNEGDHYVNFSFNENERAYIEDVKQLLKTVFGYEKAIETQTPNNHGTNVVVSSVDLAQVFKEFGKGAPNKVIPHWAMLEDPEKQKQLLSSLFHGDGNFYSKQHKSGYKETFRISTTSEKLARQAREILLRVKIPAFLNKQKRVSPRKPMYTVGVTGEYMSRFGEMVGIPVSNKMNGKNRASMFYIDDDFLYVPIKRITKKEVRDIPVYDISVEDLHTYVAAGVTVHNCSAPQYSANSLHAGCVEIFVKKNARMRYSSVENWSKNTYNLNTKRAMVDENSLMEWVSAQTGSGVTMLYPCSVLKGEGAKADHISIAVAGKNQFQDTGAKVYHLAPRTTSIIRAKSISKDGGVNTFRGHVKVNKSADECKVSVKCDALQMDLLSVSNTYPFMKILNSQTDVAHEATVGKIDSSQLFYLMSRGLDEEQAMQLIVQGFIENIVKELPLEYAVELNRLIALEMESHSA